MSDVQVPRLTSVSGQFFQLLLISGTFTDVSDLTNSYFNLLSAIINNLAPMKTRTVIMHPNQR